MIIAEKMLFATVVLAAIFASCQCIPLIASRNTLEQDALDAVIASGCSPNGGCWEWLPVREARENIATLPEDIPLPKMQMRREALHGDPNAIIESWNDDDPTVDKRVRSLSTIAKKIENGTSKKDVLTSRSRGAVGMPFSVLYMNQHSHRGTAQQQQQVAKTTETSAPSAGHPNYRIAIRNGAPSQPRRQYSIIPQLFISYGWGPFGK
ncbi:uncharacterized protein LOC122399552 isoform X1 [Colletes gigas]|uniref:uncharacterized protein LOC122399552 isoform X1 n=1 Tax=Colletes gigas TaxID=935657 RepID=UPI001C9A513B|nr:uncharacterized protein LOC122399552 isoform X1 [Colletes gigas]